MIRPEMKLLQMENTGNVQRVKGEKVDDKLRTIYTNRKQKMEVFVSLFPCVHFDGAPTPDARPSIHSDVGGSIVQI